MNEHRYTPRLGRTVELRDNNSDKQMWEDTFVLGYNDPPPDMPVPKTVLDLGANIGLTAAYYAEMWRDASIWMIEPHPGSLALAGVNAPRCNGLLCAVAPERGIYHLDGEARTASAYRLGPCGPDVEAYSIHELIDKLGGYVDFVKMDIEGMEWRILEEPFSASHLMVEFHTSGSYQQALENGLDLLTLTGWDARHYPDHHPAAVYATR